MKAAGIAVISIVALSVMNEALYDTIMFMLMYSDWFQVYFMSAVGASVD